MDVIRIRTRGLRQVQRRLRRLARNLHDADEIARQLADIGYQVAYGVMVDHVWSGETINNLEVVQVAVGRYRLTTTSGAILFFEFGAGARYGGGHPDAPRLGMGPGSYPGQTHAYDPRGWWFHTDDPALIVAYDADGNGLGHSYGNPPHMPFYQADAQIRADILTVARRVLMPR